MEKRKAKKILCKVTKYSCCGYEYIELGVTNTKPEVGSSITYFDENGNLVDTKETISCVDSDDDDYFYVSNILVLNDGAYLLKLKSDD